MSIAQTYRRFTAQFTAAIDFLASGLGLAWSQTLAVVQDALAEGARQSFLQGLPGNPEQTEDSLNQVGSDRELFRYRDESFASWSTRVHNAWQYYEQAGSPIQVLRAINEWGAIVFSATWNPANVFLVEGVWARFTIFMLPGTPPWQPATAYGSGHTYGEQNLLYGLSNAKLEDVTTLVRIVKKWKPKRSRGEGIIVTSGHVYGEPLLTYGGGAVYGDATVVRLTL